MGRTSSTELQRLCTSNQVLMLSPKSYKSIATKIDLSIMIHFQLVKFVQSQNQKMKSTFYSLQFTPKNKDTDLYRKWNCIWFLTKTLKRENSTNVRNPNMGSLNSLITNVLRVTIYCALPLYPARSLIAVTFIQLLNYVRMFQQLHTLVEKQLFL